MTGVTDWRSSMKVLIAFYSRSGEGPIYAESERIYKQFKRRDNEIK